MLNTYSQLFEPSKVIQLYTVDVFHRQYSACGLVLQQGENIFNGVGTNPMNLGHVHIWKTGKCCSGPLSILTLQDKI